LYFVGNRMALLAKWIDDKRKDTSYEDFELDRPTGISGASGRRTQQLLPCSLAILFKGGSKRPAGQRSRPPDREALLMELLAAEHDDEAPDYGALSEGSGRTD
jgi:hypothetical protein